MHAPGTGTPARGPDSVAPRHFQPQMRVDRARKVVNRFPPRTSASKTIRKKRRGSVDGNGISASAVHGRCEASEGDRVHLRGAAAPAAPSHQLCRVVVHGGRARQGVGAEAGRQLQPPGAAARVRATAAASASAWGATERRAVAAGVGQMEGGSSRRRR